MASIWYWPRVWSNNQVNGKFVYRRAIKLLIEQSQSFHVISSLIYSDKIVHFIPFFGSQQIPATIRKHTTEKNTNKTPIKRTELEPLIWSKKWVCFYIVSTFVYCTKDIPLGILLLLCQNSQSHVPSVGRDIRYVDVTTVIIFFIHTHLICDFHRDRAHLSVVVNWKEMFYRRQTK